MVGQDNTFNSSDLLKYAESLIKETKCLETKVLDQSNYGWLKSRHLQSDNVIGDDLEELKPMIRKLNPESCTSIAVKLEILTEHITSTTEILSILKNLLEEEDSMTLVAGSVKRGKEMKNKNENKVHPVLMPPGRQATVSFVLQGEN